MDDGLGGLFVTIILFLAASGLLFWIFLVADNGAASACAEIHQVEQCVQVWQPVR